MCHDTRSGMFACSFIRDGVCDDGGEGAFGHAWPSQASARSCMSCCPSPAGSSFHRCSLGTDCEDCNGPRTQACGPGVEYEPTHSYSYGDTTGGDDATAVCVGDPGVPMCDAAQCQEWKRPNCFSCMCMTCDFCAGALESITSPPPPHPQPPPPDAFSCDMLTDRDDLRRDSSDAQCYSVVRDAAKCARSYTYDAFAEDGPDLRLCLARSDGMCESWPIDPSLFESDYCQSKLWFPPPPPPPPSPPPSPNPPPPPSMPPPSPPPSPPSPPPCLPRSAKCGGHGWTGLTNCCMEGGPFAYTSCIKQNEYRSQCRDDCPPDWDCQHIPHYGMSQFAWGMYTMSGGATPTPSPEPEVDAGQGTVTDVEQELESPPPPPPPPPGAANHQQPATPTPSKGSGVDSSKADGSTSPSAAPQHSSSGLVAGLVIAALFVVCFGLLCRRWAQRGAQMRKGNRLHDETVAEAGEWAREEPGLEMPMVDDEPAATRL